MSSIIKKNIKVLHDIGTEVDSFQIFFLECGSKFPMYDGISV